MKIIIVLSIITILLIAVLAIKFKKIVRWIKSI